MNRWDRNVRDAGVISNELGDLLAEAFFVCNIPLLAVENRILRQLIQALAQTNVPYTPPSRRYLAGTILNRVSNGATQEKTQLIQGDTGIMEGDAWKNKAANSKIFGFTVSMLRVKNICSTARDVSLLRGNAANLARMIKEVID
ncbi:hypothetical protein QAD02_007436 [Eretmocerus hayati]|uniref:Uncharacterized protein n=1 Tax=Eretmocerus hayati TaxID=131215 RepID=A0ACC2N3X6_9HYME|nr:hypothetical protein QAD02_007436 [Eretmocerus hayati]